MSATASGRIVSMAGFGAEANVKDRPIEDIAGGANRGAERATN